MSKEENFDFQGLRAHYVPRERNKKMIDLLRGKGYKTKNIKESDLIDYSVHIYLRKDGSYYRSDIYEKYQNMIGG